MNAPTTPPKDRILNVLMLEDSALDAELVTEALAATELAMRTTRVVSERDFVEAVRHGTWDLILADYALPSFDGVSALALAREHCPDTPFIFVSGTLGEDVAVEALKQGATDYVVKQRLERLPRTILRALAEAGERRQRQQVQSALHRLLDERTALLHELDHRVKNNLQLLLSLVAMEIRQTESDETRDVLTRVKDRLQALAAVHRDLYDGKGVSLFDAAAFARTLCDELTARLARVRITPVFDLETIEIEGAKAAPMALLFNELIVNALTHAYRERQGKLRLRLAACADRMVFELSDDRFTPREKEAARAGSSGIILRALARQLGATVAWPEDDPQVLVRATMPLSANRAAHGVAPVEEERGDTLERIAESEMRLRLALDAGDLGSWEYDPSSGGFTTTATCRENFGREPGQPFSYADLIAAIHPNDRPAFEAAIRGVLTTGDDLRTECRVTWPDQTERWIRISGRVRRGEQGSLTLVGVTQDITTRRQADERQRLLLHELNHRVKNTLATVQSIASQTRRSAEAGDPTAWDAFLGRLQGLAKTNDLLTATNWSGAYLDDVLASELAPFQDTLKRRVRLRGPRVRLQPGAVLALGLAVHELATNAAKYGSLSREEGRVHVMWAVTRGSSPASLLVEWVETGGPPVSPPKRQGFGSRLIQRGLAQQLGGEIKHTFAPGGVRCVITFPMAGIVTDLDEDGDAPSKRYAS